MELKELIHKISMGLVKFERSYGTRPDTLILGKNEYDILGKSKSLDGLSTDKVWWGMKVCLDKNSDSCIKMTREKPDIFSYEEDFFSPYRMKVDVVVPLKFKKVFKSFVLKQNNSGIGVQILKTQHSDLKKEDYTRFQLHVYGKTKELVTIWSSYLSEIERILNYGFERKVFMRKLLEEIKEI